MLDSSAQPWVLILSVGGSPEPIIKSINEQKPPYIIFLPSLGTHQDIRQKIEPRLTYSPTDKYVGDTLSNPQDLMICVQEMRQTIEKALKAMGLAQITPLVADITGGTKIMSAALSLVMMEYEGSRFSYVGGEKRTKNGVGVVENGWEQLRHLDNPWEIMALRELRDMAQAFNEGRFHSALEIARQLANNIDDKGKKKFYSGWQEILEAYHLWDSFNYKKARGKYEQGLGKIEPYMAHKFRKGLLKELNKSHELLNKTESDFKSLDKNTKENSAAHKDSGQIYLRDLVANAQRRGQAGRFDDAVARLYSVIEKAAKIKLQIAHDIDNSKVDKEKVPKKYQTDLPDPDDKGRIRLALEKSFHLLEALGDPLGHLYRKREAELRKNLGARNMSLLAHGYKPVEEQTYKDLLNLSLDFLELKEDELPRFPRLDWKIILW